MILPGWEACWLNVGSESDVLGELWVGSLISQIMLIMLVDGVLALSLKRVKSTFLCFCL